MIQSHTSLPKEAFSLKTMIITTSALGLLAIYATTVFGLNVLVMVGVSYLSALVIELMFAKGRKRPLDYGWFVNPMIFALVLPPTSTWWMVMIGSMFGTFYGKAIFGGTGRNIFHPAAVGWVFLAFAFPNLMLTNWLNPVTNDIVSTATPLIQLNAGATPYPFTIMTLLMGQHAGSAGETFRLGILVLGLVLILIKAIDWKIPTFYLGTVFVLNYVGILLGLEKFKDPVLSLVVGGLMFAAFFMASDPVTSPYTPYAKIFYGIGLGVITVLIRNFAAFPEGAMFAILIMNAIAPMLDNMKINKKFVKEASV
ncbi:MAG: RnfABCDGE type electron transport complex subunit D [Erysipelotrichaceae bacterium]|nr:RnfABCDGE type electron transport complex subunit D [Erysipelotrichaceae bacterium]